jgi:N6-adenosine-specific RNA methylase IME4
LADDALLFLWRVASQQEEALRVMRAWDFVPKSEIVWIKTQDNVTHPHVLGGGLAFGMGRYCRHCHEVCLIGSRGKGVRLVKNRSVRSVFFAPRGKHSEKPDKMYEIIESLADGPYLELFARRHRPGWLQFGDQLPGGKANP